MYEHYITIDAQSRIIDGFTTAQRSPGEGDIFLHEGGEIFELFGKDPNRMLFFFVEGVKVWQYAYEDNKPRNRTTAEIQADMPPIPHVPTPGERLDDAEADIQTLNDTILIMLGGEVNG